MTNEAFAHPTTVDERSGIRVLSLRLSAGGYMLELRYRVIDAALARARFAGYVRPYVVDQASGNRLAVAGALDAGPLSTTLEADRVYVVFFANAARVVKPHRRVTVVAGDLRLDLEVESGLEES